MGAATTAPRSDPATWRQDFPLIEEAPSLAYLDNAATTQKPIQVLDAVRAYYRRGNANVHRAAHRLSDAATEAFEGARRRLAARFGARAPQEVIWTRGATEAINLIAAAYAPLVLGEGDNVVISRMEHHSNIVPWQIACARFGAKLRAVGVLPSGELDLADFKAKLDDRTKIVSLTHVSNALGTVNPIAELAGWAKSAGAAVVVDGAQATAHFDVDVQALGADFYVFSGHKMYAPTGIGALIGRQALLEAMPPWQTGGEMIEHVRIEATTYAPLPFKFEAGTPNIAGAIGLAAAVDYLGGLDADAVARHEADLLAYASAGLNQIDGVRVLGTGADKGPVVSFLTEQGHPQDIGALLDQQGVAVRAGHHCAMPLMEALGVPGTVRASFGVYNSRADVDALVAAVQKARSLF